MNLAFATLLIVFFALPGIALRKSYFAGKFSTSGFTTNYVSLIVWSLIPAIVLHSLYLPFCEWVCGCEILVGNFGYLLSGGNDKALIQEIFYNIHDNNYNILAYNASLTILAIGIGCCSRYIVRFYGWDIQFEFLRFPNDWHYYFNGEYVNFNQGKRYHNEVGFILVDALVQSETGSIIYSGVFEDYYLSKSVEGLDRITIKFPSKKDFSIEGGREARVIPGNYLTIPYSRITNINYTYLNVSIEPDEENDLQEKPESPC